MNEPEIPQTPEELAQANAEFAEVGPDQTRGTGGALPDEREQPVAVINGQIVGMPFFDPGDGLWGGVSLGDVVAYYPPDSKTWEVALVLRLRTDVTADLFVPRLGGNAWADAVPHHADRARGGACWSHRNEEWCVMGWIKDELEAGVGGPGWEERHPQPTAAPATEGAAP